ncbi:MAG: 4-vinyl reductase [Spirochaetaceae bacterium]|jgi:predicted hydrocarbon binding protein|nr:4-vinyl reductase [Spirochaetaceae bacterium]
MGVDTRKYKFSWDDTIGADMQIARPSLGPSTRIETYRLFQFTLRDVLEQHYGTDEADNLFREAGVLAGKSFFDKYLSDIKDVAGLANRIQCLFNELGIGIFRVEAASSTGDHFIFTVDEDLDCSGLPDTADVVCVYDEGFIQGILEAFSGKGFNVREVDCWCTGSRTCRFEAKGNVQAS